MLEEEAAVSANALTTQLQKTPVSELHNIKYDSFFCYGFICLMPFSLFLFGFEFSCIWQLLVFNMVFSLMLNDMYITLETWELISFANIFII